MITMAKKYTSLRHFFQISMAAAAKSFKQSKLDLLNANILCTNVALMGGGYWGNTFL
jgi:hypothetical protein